MIFRRRKNADAGQVLRHLVDATTKATIETGSPESAVDHLIADLSGLSRGTLIRTAALAAMLEGDARGQQVRGELQGALREMMGRFTDAMAPEGAQEPADGPEAPTDLLEDAEPIPEPETAAQPADEKVWTEDRT